jgi:hypothetical protein
MDPLQNILLSSLGFGIVDGGITTLRKAITGHKKDGNKLEPWGIQVLGDGLGPGNA